MESTLPAEPFMWRDQRGNRHYIKDMDTHHLFCTFRMIWNNTMPVEARVGYVRLYRFGPFYTPDYMKGAILAIWPELTSRKDLPADFRRQIEQMRAYYMKLLQEKEGACLPLP